ncbi:MAG: hypothetical protein AB7O73_15620, partial [Bacteroidia bacterium]
MKAILSILQVLSLTLLFNCSDSGNSPKADVPKTPEELRAELKQQEESTPLEYLRDNGVTMKPQHKKTRNAGLFRSAEYAPDGAIFEGDII